jgi:hypothetical protein
MAYNETVFLTLGSTPQKYKLDYKEENGIKNFWLSEMKEEELCGCEECLLEDLKDILWESLEEEKYDDALQIISKILTIKNKNQNKND